MVCGRVTVAGLKPLLNVMVGVLTSGSVEALEVCGGSAVKVPGTVCANAAAESVRVNSPRRNILSLQTEAWARPSVTLDRHLGNLRCLGGAVNQQFRILGSPD